MGREGLANPAGDLFVLLTIMNFDSLSFDKGEGAVEDRNAEL